MVAPNDNIKNAQAKNPIPIENLTGVVGSHPLLESHIHNMLNNGASIITKMAGNDCKVDAGISFPKTVLLTLRSANTFSELPICS